MSATLRALFLLGLIAALSGCARQIPNRVTADEYALYSAWITTHFSMSPPHRLYFSSLTGSFDPLDGSCRTPLEKDGVKSSLISQMHALGDARYQLNFYSATNLQIPWSYTEVDTAPEMPQGTFHWITFSRVVFSRDHSEALFAFFDACAQGECGHGGYVEGRKTKGKWRFRPVGCSIVS